MSVTLVTRDPFPGGSFPLAGRLTSRVGYGMGQVTRHAGNSEAQAKAVELLHVAFNLGITHFDTAQFYGDGLANELLRASFGNRRNDILIATKAEAKPVPGAPIPLEAAQKPFELRAAVEANLRTLGTNWIDVVNLRRMDFTPGLLAGGEQVVPFEDQLAEMAALRDEGKILGIGLSHVTVEQLRTAMPVGISCVQTSTTWSTVPKSRCSSSASRTTSRGFRTPPRWWLGTLPKVIDQDRVQVVAFRLGVTASQVGLAWQHTHSPNTMLIPGTSSIEHLKENTAAGKIRLDKTAMSALDTAAADHI